LGDEIWALEISCLHRAQRNNRRRSSQRPVPLAQRHRGRL